VFAVIVQFRIVVAPLALQLRPGPRFPENVLFVTTAFPQFSIPAPSDALFSEKVHRSIVTVP
jgi:hypothetical protein